MLEEALHWTAFFFYRSYQPSGIWHLVTCATPPVTPRRWSVALGRQVSTTHFHAGARHLACGERKQGSPHPSAKRRSHHSIIFCGIVCGPTIPFTNAAAWWLAPPGPSRASPGVGTYQSDDRLNDEICTFMATCLTSRWSKRSQKTVSSRPLLGLHKLQFETV